jgi:hypothetical protein
MNKREVRSIQMKKKWTEVLMLAGYLWFIWEDSKIGPDIDNPEWSFTYFAYQHSQRNAEVIL